MNSTEVMAAVLKP